MSRFSIRGPFKRRNKTMALSSVEGVELRHVVMGRTEHPELVFVPRAEAGDHELKVKEFWTHSAAEDAHAAVHVWLKRS